MAAWCDSGAVPHRRATARASGACLGLALLCAASLPWAYEVDPLAPFIACGSVFVLGMTGFVLALRADRMLLAIAGAAVGWLLLPVLFGAVTLVGGP